MKVYPVADPRFARYGRVLEGYDLTELLAALARVECPQEGIRYLPSVEGLESCAVFGEMQQRGFGGMPIQIGFVSGHARQLDCLEYHKTSEFNIALDAVVLVVGFAGDVADAAYDTANCEAFLLPAGCGVELFATTLHYAPWHVQESGYRVACVLPRGTNGPAEAWQGKCAEDKLYYGTNKWLLAHPAAAEAAKGAHPGLRGKNLIWEMLEISGQA